MTWDRLIALALWFSGPVMQILLLLQARRRRLWHVCPAFFVYTAFQIVKAAVLFTVSDPKAYKLYFVAYWTGEVIDVLLVVAVLYQLYSLLFLGYEGLRVLQDVLFRWATAVCVLIAVTVAASVPGADSSRLLAGLLAVHVGAAILKAGLIIFAMVMSSALALRWNHYAFGALVGFALYNTVELAAGAARVNLGMIASGPYRLISPAAYSCGMLVWVAYFFSKEKEPVPLKSVPENSLAAWNQALLELLTK